MAVILKKLREEGEVKSGHTPLGAVLLICVINRCGFAKLMADDLFKVWLKPAVGISAWKLGHTLVK